MTTDADTKDKLAQRISTIEEAYEFMLAYAAQGQPRGMEGDHIRDHLTRADGALDGIGDAALAAVAAIGADPATFRPFVAALNEDAQRSRAGLKLALSQRKIGSQLV